MTTVTPFFSWPLERRPAPVLLSEAEVLQQLPAIAGREEARP